LVTASILFNPPVLAHRGASADAPENTMPAFVRAVQLGIQWVEFDVMLAACGTPIIFHDETLDRTTNASGDVGAYPYVYLQTLDAGSWFKSTYSGEKIPTLDQAAEFLVGTGLHANVEIKPLPGQDEATVDATLKVMSAYFAEDSPQILYSSFSIPTLKYLRARAPHCLMGLLMHEWLSDWQQIADALHCVAINVNEEILTAERVRQIKDTGRMLLSYTVNNIDRAEQLYGWGVDAVFSDHAAQIARFA
jgi:glycerophosphoryl diester phosphodiesterase